MLKTCKPHDLAYITLCSVSFNVFENDSDLNSIAVVSVDVLGTLLDTL